jgi:hypothetical protein
MSEARRPVLVRQNAKPTSTPQLAMQTNGADSAKAS